MYIQNLDEVLPLLRGKLREYLTLKLDLRSNAKKFQCFVHHDSEPSMYFNPKTHEETVHCFGCLPENSEIRTPKGLTLIKDVSVGDRIYDAAGFSGVVTAKEYKTRNLFYNFQLGRTQQDPIWFSSDHEMLVVKNIAKKVPYIYFSETAQCYKYTKKLKNRKRCYKYSKAIKTERVTADKVIEGDYFIFPQIQESLEVDSIWNEHTSKKTHYPVSVIPINEETMFLFGLFCAEGSTYRGGITLTMHIDEEPILQHIKTIIKENFNRPSTIAKLHNRNVSYLTCSNTDISLFFKKSFGTGCKNKTAPQWFSHLPHSLQKAFIEGVMTGDGNKNNEILITTSKHLVSLIQQMLVNLSLPWSVSYNESYVAADGIKRKPTWILRIKRREDLFGFYEIVNNQKVYLQRIGKIKTENKDQQVIDITTVSKGYSHTFMCRDFAVHNCNVSFDIFGCAEKIDGLPSSGPEWITETVPALCELLQIPLKLGEVSVADRERARLLKLTQDIADCLVENSPDEIAYVEARNWKQPYLAYGSVDETILINKVMEKGWSAEEINKSLIVKTKYVNYFGLDKITFVIKDHRGRAIGFVYKDLSKPDGRYVNSADSQLYNKSRALLGIENAIKTAKTDGVIVVEGPGDLASLNRVGIVNAVAVCGTAFTEHHLLHLKNLGIQKIYFCLDWDKAGYAATSNILETVLRATSGVSVFVITAPESDIKDPDELLRKSKTAEPFTSLKILTGFQWKLAQFKDESPDTICEKMILIIASEPTAIRRELLINSLADFTDVSPQAILTDVRAIIDNRFDKYKQRVVATAEAALQEITEDPESARTIIAQQESRIEEIENEFEQNTIGVNHQLMRLDLVMKEISGEGGETAGGFKMNHLSNIKSCFDGGSSWTEGCLISLPGKAHSGKTALSLAIAADIALSDEDALAIVYSTDDSYKLILPRITSNLYHISFPNGPILTNGMLAQPLAHLPATSEYQDAFQEAQDLLKFLISEEKLIIIDGDSGRTVSTLQKQLRYYRKRFPARKIFCVLDKILSRLTVR